MNSLKGKNILIAGASGLVGANLTLKLQELHANIHPTFFSRKPDFLTKHFKRFDFTQFEDCLKATKHMDYVFICAAQISGAQMTKNHPEAFVRDNLKIHTGLLEACSLNKVKKVVLISSSTVYQEADYPIAENELDLNQPPCSFYFAVGWFNRYIEQLAKFYFLKKQLTIGIVRPTNIYGPYDRFDDDRAHVIPALIRRALKKENPFVIWGDPHVTRDFLYVEDFVLDLINVLGKYCVCDPINVGCGRATTVDEAAKIILKTCWHHPIMRYNSSRPTAISYRMLNVNKFAAIFGKSKRTTFKEGIQKTVTWYGDTQHP